MSTVFTKPFVWSPIIVTGNYTLGSNGNNLIVANLLTNSIINLPALAEFVGGFPILFNNFSNFTLTVQASGSELINNANSIIVSKRLTIFADKENNKWQIIDDTTGYSLATTGSSVDISASNPPLTGQVLVATSPVSAMWETVTSGPSFSPFSQTLAVYVDKSGNDTTGIGAPNNPYLTINKALSVITDASTTKRYRIMVGTGRFDETTYNLKPWIWIIGTQRTATRTTIASGDLTLDSSFANGNFRAGMKDILLSGSANVNFDLQTIGGSGSTVIELQTTFINNAFTFKGRTSADFVEARECQLLGAVLISSMAGLLKDCNTGSNVTVDDVGGTENVHFDIDHCTIGGNLIINQTRANIFDMRISSTFVQGQSLTIAGVNNAAITLDADTIPLTFSSSGSFTIIKQSRSTGVGYTPTTSSNWTTIPTDVQTGLDVLATYKLDTQFTVVDAVDKTKKVQFDVQGTTGIVTTIVTNPTVNRNFRTPDIDGTSLVSQDITGQVFINSTTSLHGSNAGLQMNSNVSNRGSARTNQYGNNTGVPGVTGFKSRGTNIGDLTGVIDGDSLYRATAIGVTPDNVNIPIAGLFQIYVPTGGSVGSNNYVASEYNIQLTPLTGPINGRKEAFRVSSEGVLHIKESANTMAGVATLGGAGTFVVSNTQITATSKILLTVQDGGTVPTGMSYISTRSNGVSFTITSTAGVIDSGVKVYYQIWEPTIP